MTGTVHDTVEMDLDTKVGRAVAGNRLVDRGRVWDMRHGSGIVSCSGSGGRPRPRPQESQTATS
jgi:hypothetical protein